MDKLLLVEDNPDDVVLIRESLARLVEGGFELHESGQLSDAVSQLARERFRVVLLDLALPDSTGLETIRRLRREDGAVPVIVLTGQEDDDLGVQAVQVGAHDYLTKREISADVLIRAIRYAIERERLHEQIRQAQKMEAVGRLAGGIAHDFNNQIFVIRGYADLLLQRAPTDMELRRPIEEIRRAAAHSAELTAQLLAFGRKQRLEPKVLDVGEELASLEGMIQRLVGERVAVSIMPTRDLGRIRADPNRLQQVIVNLVVNARDALPDGGRISIEARNVGLDPEYARTHADVSAGPYVMISVADNGHGMERKDLARIFEPFFTTKEMGKGTGLGLSTVHGIVKQSGGHIEVYSELGRGTTFKIYLPRVDQPVTEKSLSPSTQAGGVETIFVAEDEPGVRKLMQSLLAEQGYDVHTAVDGVELLRLAAEHDGPIHMVLTDVVMPRMNGPELVERLCRKHPETRVIYMSGYTEHALTENGDVEKGIAFLQKPCPADQLLRKVREVLDRE